MKKIIPYIIALGTIIGCSASNINSNYEQFEFKYEGKNYQISSQLNSKAEGGNSLLSEDRTIIARDYDQDTTIDQIIRGEITIAEAQKIYDYGMNKVTEKNLLRNPQEINRYKTRIGNNMLIATGCSIDSMNCRIELFGELENRDRIFAQDYKSDGIIDNVETGYTHIDILQDLYSKLLQKGITEGNITKEGDKYRIENKK